MDAQEAQAHAVGVDSDRAKMTQRFEGLSLSTWKDAVEASSIRK
jgi:hypothetical protein